ncbi:MAG: hypothetical protein ACUVWK_04330 [Nitrososphaerales archaeon]
MFQKELWEELVKARRYCNYSEKQLKLLRETLDKVEEELKAKK